MGTEVEVRPCERIVNPNGLGIITESDDSFGTFTRLKVFDNEHFIIL